MKRKLLPMNRSAEHRSASCVPNLARSNALRSVQGFKARIWIRGILSLALLAMASSFAGCVISIGGRTQTSPPEPAPPPPVVVTDPEQAATIAEIDAAARFNMDSARAQSLSQIAERPALSTAVQVHLINTTYRCLSFESSKVQVLEKLIARPDFSDATRHAIVSQFHRLSFESSKQELLNRINQRVTQGSTQ